MADTGFTRPTLTTIDDRIKSDINARLPGADARLRRSFLGVLARVQAGVAHGLYGYQAYIARQAIVDTADTDGIEAWGRVWGILRKLATRSTGNISVTGTNGATIAVDVEIQRADGTVFKVTTGATISGGVATVAVQAVSAGDAGNTDAAATASFISPISGVNSACVVAAGGLTGGTDDEADPLYKARILARIQNPPHGGSKTDYEAWALEVPGVTRAWVYPLELGAGTVSVRFMMDATYSDGIPLSGDVATVQAYIDDPLRRPVTADVTVVAPVAEALDVTISNLTLDTAATRSAIEEELADMIARAGKPGGTIPISKIWEAVSLATGEESHTITVPTGDVTHTTGKIPVLGAVTYA